MTDDKQERKFLSIGEDKVETFAPFIVLGLFPFSLYI